MERDHRRDQWFLANGWTVLRFMDREVINETSYVAEVIIAALLDPTTATIHLAQIHASRGLPPTKVPPLKVGRGFVESSSRSVCSRY